MSLKDMIMQRYLPTDEEVMKGLEAARLSGNYPVQYVGEAVTKQMMQGGEIPTILKNYPKTLAWLTEPQNLEWLMADMERTLNYLKSVSEALNRQP